MPPPGPKPDSAGDDDGIDWDQLSSEVLGQADDGDDLLDAVAPGEEEGDIELPTPDTIYDDPTEAFDGVDRPGGDTDQTDPDHAGAGSHGGPPVPRFRANSDGTFGVDLGEAPRRFLRHVIGDLRDLILAGDATALTRLYPTAYPDDDALNEEYNEFARDQLLESRLSGLDLVEETLDNDTLTEGELSAWMRALNELRLVIGTMLDVSEDDIGSRELDLDDPDDYLYAIYREIGGLVGRIVSALAATLPPGDDES